MMRIQRMALAAVWILGMPLAAHAQTTLRSEAEKRGFLIGCASWESRTHGHEPAYTETLAREFNLVSTRAQLCTAAVQRTRGTYDFDEADKVFEFAREHQMKVYGHCLLSSQDNSATLPRWIQDGGSMKARGVPLHAVGLQCYFDPSTQVADLAHAMALFADIEVRVYVTELAVRVYTDAPTPQQLQRQAAQFRCVLRTCLKRPTAPR